MADQQIPSSDISWKDFMPGFFDDLFSCTTPEELYDKYLGPSWRCNEDFWSVDACLQAGNHDGVNSSAFPTNHAPKVYIPQGDTHFPENANQSRVSVSQWNVGHTGYSLGEATPQPTSDRAFATLSSRTSGNVVYNQQSLDYIPAISSPFSNPIPEYGSTRTLVNPLEITSLIVSSDCLAPFNTQSFNESTFDTLSFSSGSQNCQDLHYLTPSCTIGEGSNLYNIISINERQYLVDKSSGDLPVEHQQSKPDSHGSYRLCENSMDSQASVDKVLKKLDLAHSLAVEQPATEISSEESQGHIPNCMKGFDISVTRERKQRRNDN